MARCVSPISIPHPHGTKKSVRLSVPCGKCLMCFQNKRADWTIRMLHELRYSERAYFVTLTYNDEMIPLVKKEDRILSTIDKNHIQGYIKRLRSDVDRFHKKAEKSLSQKIKKPKLRYFIVGEYGSKSLRAHYHGILFNVPIELEQKLIDQWKIGTGKSDEKGKELLSDAGFVHLGEVTEKSIHYTTKYILDAMSTIKTFSSLKNSKGEWLVQKPFNLMSKYPPIGIKYVEKSKEYHRNSQHNYITRPGGYKQRLPRVYKEKIFNEKERLLFAEKQEEEANRKEEDRIKEWKKKGINEYYNVQMYKDKVRKAIRSSKSGKI